MDKNKVKSYQKYYGTNRSERALIKIIKAVVDSHEQ